KSGTVHKNHIEDTKEHKKTRKPAPFVPIESSSVPFCGYSRFCWAKLLNIKCWNIPSTLSNTYPLGPVVPVQAGASLAGNDSSEASLIISLLRTAFDSAAFGISPVSSSCLTLRNASSINPSGRSPSKVAKADPSFPAGGLY